VVPSKCPGRPRLPPSTHSRGLPAFLVPINLSLKLNLNQFCRGVLNNRPILFEGAWASPWLHANHATPAASCGRGFLCAGSPRSTTNLDPGAIGQLFDHTVAVGPPRASVVSKLHGNFATVSPHHRAMVHAGVANDPEPKGGGKYPSRVNLQLGASRRYLTYDAFSWARLAGHDYFCRHIGRKARLVLSFFSACCHGFLTVVKHPRCTKLT
jgi:hypothetical protein